MLKLEESLFSKNFVDINFEKFVPFKFRFILIFISLLSFYKYLSLILFISLSLLGIMSFKAQFK